MPGLATTMVMSQKMSLTNAMPKNNPINPNAATLKYHTPNRIVRRPERKHHSRQHHHHHSQSGQLQPQLRTLVEPDVVEGRS